MKENLLSAASIVLLCIVLARIAAHDLHDLLKPFFSNDNERRNKVRGVLLVAVMGTIVAIAGVLSSDPPTILRP